MTHSISDTSPVVILGAGLAGLSASMHLRERGVAHRVFERDAAPGGHATTTEDSGFRFDRTGHLLHLRDDALRAQVTSWLGDALLAIDRRSVVWSHGVATRYPFQANLHGLPPDVASECLLGYLRARDAQREMPRGSAALAPPATFEEFILRHFGEGIARHFMVPYNAKLWGVHPRNLSAAWTGRFVPIPRLEDVVAGAFGAAAPSLGYNARFYYPRHGIGDLTRALIDHAGPIELRRAARRIDLARREIVFDDEVVRYDRLVSTIPLPALIDLLTDVPEVVREASGLLRCTRLWYLDVALHGPCERDWHWAYVPEPEIPFYRVGSYSNFSRAMAPPGAGSLYVELSSRAEPDLKTLLPIVADHLVRMGVVASPERIRFCRARSIESAYVVFDHHHDGAVRTLHDFLASHDVQATGRYGAWTYASMEDAMLMGRAAALSSIE